jgi:hypothetical protein
MRANRLRSSIIVLPVALASWVLACGSTPSPTGPVGTASSALSGTSSADAETARVKAYLDSRYTAADVRHSFRTALGQTIDCIDFFAQPGVKSRAAKGHPITKIPQVHPNPAGIRPNPGGFDGEPDENGSPRKCPDGTVPEVRLLADRIASSGGLDALKRVFKHKAAPTNLYTVPPGCPSSGFTTCMGQQDWPDYAHIISSWTGGTNTAEVVDIMSVNAPLVPDNENLGNHSLEQIWLLSGTGFADFGCSCCSGGTCFGAVCGGGECTGVSGSYPPCTQSVETGVMVEPWLNNLTGTSAEAPAVFVFATNDGYWSSCFDDNISTGGGGCPVDFVAASSSSYPPGMALTPGVLGGSATEQQELSFVVENTDGGWSITVGGSNVGYYVADDYNGSMVTEASAFQVGAEIADNTGACTVPMGSGANPVAGLAQAGFHSYYAAIPVGSNTINTSFTTPQSSVPSVYTWSTAPASPFSAPAGDYFYVGNASQSFGPSAGDTDFGSAWWPTSGSSWEPGSYTADCGLLDGQGIPISGVSESYTGTYKNQAHAIQCWEAPYGSLENGSQSIPTTASSCYPRALGSDDDRGYSGSLDPGTNGDWDPGYYKVECKENEYVNGLAVNASGQVDAVLCCPGGMAHAGCNAQTFSNGNSSSFALPDWDYGYYKGQCGVDQYVAGISTPAFGQQPYGTPHSILCCY